MFPGIDPDYRLARLFSANLNAASQGTIQPYNVPDGARMLMAFGAGGAGGGGGGFGAAAGTARGGGGSGGMPPLGAVLIPTALFPSVLGVQVGRGGIGGGPAANGTSGGATAIVLPRRYGGSNVYPLFTFTGGAGGNAGSATAGGSAGGTSAFTWQFGVTNINATQQRNGIAGGAQTGAAGGNAGSGTSWQAPGASGAGIGTANTVFAGGNVLSVRSTLSGGTGDGGRGQDGYSSDPLSRSDPFMRIGGSGGASSALGAGGDGGHGGLATSGAGGGAGLTGGRGGNGGDGFLIIIPIF